MNSELHVTATASAEVRDPAAFDNMNVPGLNSRFEVERHFTIECFECYLYSANRVDHVNLNGREQVVALTSPHVVRRNLEFDVDVTLRPASFSDFANSGQVCSHSRFDTGWDCHLDCGSRANTTVSSAGWARCRNHCSETTTTATRGVRHDVSEETANLSLDGAGTATHVTSLW